MKSHQPIWVTMACLLLFFTAHPAAAQVPDTINFQGLLADDTGVPVPDGSYTMRFYLYDAATGGDQLWNNPNGEQQTVAVTDGVYDVQLGINQPLDSTIFDGGAAWLEVVVEGETLSPRQQITAAPYALKAGDADTLTGYALTDLDDRYVVHGETGAVDSNMITDGSVTSDDLGYDSVNASEIVAGAVRSSEVANNSLTAADLAIDSVTASEIAEGAVGSSEIADGSITVADLSDGAVLDEIQDDDGPGSGLNADLLDGLSSSAFVNVAGDSMTGALSVPSLQYAGTTSFVADSNENTFVGLWAGSSNTTGQENTFLGYAAGPLNTEGQSNVFLGSYAGNHNTTGSYNVFVGQYAGVTNTEGNRNSFLGEHAGHSNWTGGDNTCVGVAAGYANMEGSGNVLLGYRAGYFETGSDKLYIDNSNTTEPLIWGDFSTNVAAINGRLGVNTQPGSAYQFHSLDERTTGRAVYGEATGVNGIGVWGRALGSGGIGIYGTGTGSGAYFKDADASGLARVAYGDRGIWAKGTMAGGTFSHPDENTHWADVSTATRKIQGTGTVSFVQNHPFDDDTVIVYAAPEGDEVAVYTRGTARLKDGEARVTLGETFQYVANPDIGLTVYLTPVGGWSDLYVAEKSSQEIVVRSAGGPASAAFDYLVYGLRLGFEEAAVLQPKQRDALLPTGEAIGAGYGERPDLRAFNAMERYREMHAAVSPEAALDLSHSRELVAALEDQRPEAMARAVARQEAMPEKSDVVNDDSTRGSAEELIYSPNTEANTAGSLPVQALITELRAEIDALKADIADIKADTRK